MDPSRFASTLGDLDLHLLGEGRHLRAYEKLGAHPQIVDGTEGVSFAVWAPNARSVSVVGDFNGWDGSHHPMVPAGPNGFWETFVPALTPGELYKFEIHGPDGTLLPLKADPFAFRCERSPGTASITASTYAWATARGWKSAGDEPMQRSASTSCTLDLAAAAVPS